MPKFRTPVSSAAALANGNAIASIVPGASANFKLIQLILGVANSGGAITDFEVAVGVNRGSARGTQSTSLTPGKADPNSAAAGITGVDSAWTIQPTLAAQDLDIYSFNSRGGLVLNFAVDDIVSTTGTANPIILVQRSGAPLPASHYITATIVHLE